MLGLADDPALAAPAIERLVAEVLEHPGGLARSGAESLGLGEFRGEHGFEALVARQAEDEVHPVGLAPGHQRVAGEAAVGAQDDLHARPGLADLKHHARHLLHRAGGGVDVGAPLPGQKQVAATEHIEGQAAVMIIIAVEEAAFPVAMQRDVRGVQVDDDLARRPVVGLEE